MRKISLIAACLLLCLPLCLFTACDPAVYESSTGGRVAYFHGEWYDEVDDSWYPFYDLNNREKMAWVGYEDTIPLDYMTMDYEDAVFTYANDPQERFISYEDEWGEYIVFHKRSDSLPTLGGNGDAVESLCLSSNDFPDIYLTGELMDELATFINQCGSDFSAYTVKPAYGDKEEGYLTWVDVYFKEYPACYSVGWLGKTENKKLGYNSYDIDDLGYSEYILLPDDLAVKLLKQLYA